MTKCLSCEASDEDVILYPVFDGDLFYCRECCEKYGVDVPLKQTYTDGTDWGTYS